MIFKISNFRLSAAYQRANRHCVNVGVTASSTATSQSYNSELSLDANETADDLGSERLPPLRELIWRRLRRRSAQVQRTPETEMADNDPRAAGLINRGVDPGVIGSIPPGSGSNNGGQMPVRTHREGLTRMVDQMRIDQV